MSDSDFDDLLEVADSDVSEREPTEAWGRVLGVGAVRLVSPSTTRFEPLGPPFPATATETASPAGWTSLEDLDRRWSTARVAADREKQWHRVVLRVRWRADVDDA